MRNFFALILAILILIGFTFSRFEISQKQTTWNVSPSSLQEAFKYAQDNLPKEGKLIVKSDGFGYLKVDDNYIHTLFPMLGLENDGFKEPPFFRTKKSPGAHISVFYGDENRRPKEVGQYFRFELKQIVILRVSKDTFYAVLQVESPELENLRKKYGLSPKLHGHEFHITLAKKTLHRNHYNRVLKHDYLSFNFGFRHHWIFYSSFCEQRT